MTLTEVSVAHGGNGIGLTPLGSALDGGFFERNGLDVQRHLTHTTDAIVQELLDGKALFGHFAAYGAVRAVAAGHDIAAIIGGFNREFLVGAPGVEDLSELEGQPVGSGRPHDLHHFYIEYTFRKIMRAPGIHVPLATDKRYQDLMDGKVKASPLSAPSAVKATMEGCKILVDYDEHGLAYSYGDVMIRRGLLDSDPELVEAYLLSLVQGLRKYKADRNFGIRMHRTYNLVPEDVAAKTYDLCHAGYNSDCPDPDTPGLRLIIDFWKEEGYLADDFQITDVIDSTAIRKVCGKAQQ